MVDAPPNTGDTDAAPGFRLEELLIEPNTGVIAGPGGREQVDPKVMAVLVALAGTPGALVPRAQLLDKLWRGGTVYDDTLTQCVYQLRRHLAAAGGSKKYRGLIETLPKRGYVLKGNILSADPASETGEGKGRRRIGLVGGALIAILIIATALWLAHRRESGQNQENLTLAGLEPLPNSIAVLPFLDLSPEQDQQYFTHGISEELLNRLAEHTELNVIGRASSFAFEDSHYKMEQISSLLRVKFLLQGSVRKDGRKMRISAELSNSSGWQLWSETYDRELGEIFSIQDEIAQAVVTSILPRVTFVPAAVAQLPDIEAYQHYLAGREVLHSRVADFDNLAAQEFRKATEIDVGYAAAYAELAIALTFASDRELHLRRGPRARRKYAEAERAIKTALTLEPGLARAYAAQGFLQLQRGQISAAEPALRKAVILDPSMSDAEYWLASILAQRDDNEGWELLQRTARVDPLLPELNYDLAWGFAERGDFDQAETTFSRLLTVAHPAPFSYRYARDFYAGTGRLVESMAVSKRMVVDTILTPLKDRCMGQLAEAYAQLGMWEVADHWQRAKKTDLWYNAFTMEPEGRFREILALWEELRIHAGITLADQDIRHVRYYGHIQALAGDYKQAIQTLEHVIDDAGPDKFFGDRRVSLAFAYLKTGAHADAQHILDRLDNEMSARELRGLLNFGPDLADYALVSLLRGDPDGAIEMLRRARDAGWRGYYAVINDPRWEGLQTDMRYRRLMTSIQAEVDTQRKEVERSDAADDFTDRVQRMLAAEKVH